MLFRLGRRGKTVCRLLERLNAVGLRKKETRLAGAFYPTICSQIFGRGAESRHSFCSLPSLRHVLAAPGAVRPAGIRDIHSAGVHQGPALSDSELQELGVAPKKSVIFDTNLKRLHRDRAALLVDGPDPLLQEVTERLLDRLEDCRKSFPIALHVGGAGEHVRRQLQGRGGIEKLMMIDSSAPMLMQTYTHDDAVDESQPSVEHRVVEGEDLNLEHSSVDVVISCMGLHWVNDLPGVMTQCRHALKPDGLFLAAMLGGDTLRELRIACTVGQQEREGGISPRVSPFAQVRDAGSLLTRAGLTLPAVDVDDLTMRYPSAIELVEHLRSMGEGNAVLQRAQSLNRDTALATAAIYQAMFGEEDGTVPATFQVIYMAGWSPHSSQQSPRTRGSASVSLKNIQESLRAGVRPTVEPTPKDDVEDKKPEPKGGVVSGRTDLPSGSWYKID